MNERHILHELRRSGTVSKPELARQIAISPQAVNGIVDGLAREGLARKCGSRGGGVGHPSTLYTLSPQGAFAIGMVISEGTMEACLIDFVGSILFRSAAAFPGLGMGNAGSPLRKTFQNLEEQAEVLGIDFQRVCGIGISVSGEFESDQRREFEESVADLTQSTGLPVAWFDHGAAGAMAELMIGGIAEVNSFLYISIGSSLNTGLVLNGELHRGGSGGCRTAYLPAPSAEQPRGRLLIKDIATTGTLDKSLRAAGFRPRGSKPIFEAMDSSQAVIDQWVESAATTLAWVAAPTHAVVGLDMLVLNAELPYQLQDRLMSSLWRELSTLHRTLPRLRVERGRHGSHAAMLGAAMLPIYRQVFPGRSGGLRNIGRPPDIAGHFAFG